MDAPFAFAASENLEMAQFNVKTAFLYGELEEDIYMSVPEGVKVKSNESSWYVYKLRKPLCELKQSPLCWHKTSVNFLRKFDFAESDSGKCIFVCKDCSDLLILALFVDDGLVVGRDRRMIDNIIDIFGKNFPLKISHAQHFCGMEIIRNRKKGVIYVHQAMYADKILKRFHMFDAHAVAVPAEPSLRF